MVTPAEHQELKYTNINQAANSKFDRLLSKLLGNLMRHTMRALFCHCAPISQP